MKLLGMAWRNIWRNSRRTAVTIAAIALGLFTMTLWSSMVVGYLERLESTILDVEVGDLQIHASDYRLNPSIYTRIDTPEALLTELEARGYKATARLLGGALVASDETSAAAQLTGINPARDAAVSEINTRVARGDWLSEEDPSGVVIGSRIARALDVSPGSELVVLSQASDGSMANELFRVRGVLSDVSAEADSAGVFVLEDTFRSFFVVPGGAHRILVRHPPGADPEIAAAEIAELVSTSTSGGEAGLLEAKPWRALFPTIATLLDSTRALMQVVFFVVYIAIGILILNAMLMAVFERIREFGVLKAIGMSPYRVFRLILIEGALQTAVAIVIGLVLAVPALFYLSRVGINMASIGSSIAISGITFGSIWYAAIQPSVFVGPVFALVAIVALAILYPGLKAARILPVEAMRYQ